MLFRSARRTETRFSAIRVSDLFIDAADHHCLQFRQQLCDHHRVQPEGMGQGKSCAHVPAQHGLARNPQLPAKASDQIPNLPAVMGLGLVQSGGAVGARAFARLEGVARLAGLAVTVAPAEVPVGEGAETFFSASSSMPGLT